MRAVIQRVKDTKLSVDGMLVSEIPYGLAVYLGVGAGDTAEKCAPMAKKIAQLRIFEDENGKMNLSVKEAGGATARTATARVLSVRRARKLPSRCMKRSRGACGRSGG